MRIITTRKLRFYTKDRKESFVTEGNNIIQECPDWAQEDSMFKAARATGQLQILTTAKELKHAENEGGLAKNSHEAKKFFHKDDESNIDESDENESNEDGSDEEDESNEGESEEEQKAAAKAAKRAARRAAKKAAKEAQE